MRWKIEFLDDSTNEFSECMTTICDGSLEHAKILARAETARARAKCRADGYQIRDMEESGRIVFLEHFKL
jgi:hypothetical protein